MLFFPQHCYFVRGKHQWDLIGWCFFDVWLNKLLNKQLNCWRFETVETFDALLLRTCCLTLWPRDAMWHHRTWSILVQVMAWCPTYNQWSLGHLCNFTGNAQIICIWDEFENYSLKSGSTLNYRNILCAYLGLYFHQPLDCLSKRSMTSDKTLSELCITGTMWRKFTGDWWIPCPKGQ